MTKQIEASLAKALLQGGKMSHALYEYEVEEHIDYWYEGLKADRDDFLFVVSEKSGHVAMLVIMPDKTICINEQARAKLAEFWKSNYMANMKRLIPIMAQLLAKHILYVTGVKVATDTLPRRVVGRRNYNLKGL
jgi:hypothetical protein